jgi:hypothetical protein
VVVIVQNGLNTAGPRARSAVEEPVEARRHHADDVERLGTDHDLPADDLRVGSEAPLPEAVAEHDDVPAAVRVFALDEGASEQRGDTKTLKNSAVATAPMTFSGSPPSVRLAFHPVITAND